MAKSTAQGRKLKKSKIAKEAQKNISEQNSEKDVAEEIEEKNEEENPSDIPEQIVEEEQKNNGEENSKDEKKKPLAKRGRKNAIQKEAELKTDEQRGNDFEKDEPVKSSKRGRKKPQQKDVSDEEVKTSNEQEKELLEKPDEDQIEEEAIEEVETLKKPITKGKPGRKKLTQKDSAEAKNENVSSEGKNGNISKKILKSDLDFGEEEAAVKSSKPVKRGRKVKNQEAIQNDINNENVSELSTKRGGNKVKYVDDSMEIDAKNLDEDSDYKPEKKKGAKTVNKKQPKRKDAEEELEDLPKVANEETVIVKVSESLIKHAGQNRRKLV